MGVLGGRNPSNTPYFLPRSGNSHQPFSKNGLIILEYGMMGPAQTGCEFNHTNR
jgi:hypothetical protein